MPTNREPTMNDVKSAAERLRQHHSALQIKRAEQSPYWNVSGGEWNRSSIDLDNETLAEAYLALVAADDDEPVDEAWLRSVGIACSMIGYNTQKPVINNILIFQNGAFSYDVAIPVRYVRTRGAVRLLARALGVELKGGADRSARNPQPASDVKGAT